VRTSPPPKVPLGDQPALRDSKITRWAESRFPYLAFVPERPRFDRPPLDILKRIGAAFPVIKDGIQYTLQPDLIRQWGVLEKQLQFYVNVLQQNTPLPLPAQETTFRLPATFGYQRHHNASHTAQICARNSQEAFLLLIARCSYLIWLHCHATLTSVGPITSWEQALSDKGVDPAHISTLRTSELGDFSPEYERVGIFVDEHCTFRSVICNFGVCVFFDERCTFRSLICDFWLSLRSVPVYVCWGKHPDLRAMPEFGDAFPTLRQMTAARKEEAETMPAARDTKGKVIVSSSSGRTPQSSSVRTPIPFLSTTSQRSSSSWGASSQPHWGSSSSSWNTATQPSSASPWGASPAQQWGSSSWDTTAQSSSADPWSSSSWDAPAQPSSANPWGSSSSWDPVQPSLDAGSSTARPLDPTFPGNPTAQRPGEHWRDYLRRMQERQKRVMVKDDDRRRQSREARELAQKRHPCPGRKGPLVFHWELPEDVGGIHMRVPVSRDAVSSVWGSWGPKQRIYNSVDNKWDVCTEFDENETPDDDSDHDDMDMPPRQPTPPPPYAPTANASLPPPPLSPPPHRRRYFQLTRCTPLLHHQHWSSPLLCHQLWPSCLRLHRHQLPRRQFNRHCFHLHHHLLYLAHGSMILHPMSQTPTYGIPLELSWTYCISDMVLLHLLSHLLTTIISRFILGPRGAFLETQRAE
jgi:hypothetical protein